MPKPSVPAQVALIILGIVTTDLLLFIFLTSHPGVGVVIWILGALAAGILYATGRLAMAAEKSHKPEDPTGSTKT